MTMSILYLCLVPCFGIFLSFLQKIFGLSRVFHKHFTFFLSCFNFLLCFFFLFFFNKNLGYFQFLEIFPWFNNFLSLDFILGVDGISLVLILLTCFLIPLCLLSSWDQININSYIFFVNCIFLIQILLILAFSVLDLFFFYVFFEIILLPMYLLIGFWGSRERKIKASYFLFIYTVFGSLFFLISICFIFFSVGTTNYLFLLNCNFSPEYQNYLWIGFFISFAVKVPMYPFHIWLPEAHVEAPTIGSMILAGLLLKLGTYAFIRFSILLLPQGSLYYSSFIFFLGTFSIIAASLAALRQSDMKRIIAYSSIAHMNLVVIGIFSLNINSMNGSIFQMISHGLVSCGLFGIVGVLYHRYHTRLVQYYGGVAHFMPIFTFFFLFLTLANISLPITSSFVGEFLLFIGIFKADFLVLLFTLSSLVLGGAYMLWLFNRISYAFVKKYLYYISDVSEKEFVFLFIFSFFILLLGIKPDFLINYFNMSSLSITIMQLLKIV